MLPIVLIHGFPLDGTMWRAQAEFLRAAGYRVLVPDLAGFGDSPVAPDVEESSIERYAAEVYAVIQAAGGKAVVGGLSMGGYVLLALLREHPECVAGAMFIDTRAEADTPEGKANRLKSIEDIRVRGTAALIDGLCGRLFRKVSDPAVVEETRTIMRRQRPDAVIAAQWAMAHRRDQTDFLPTLTIPALVIVGEEDLITPPEAARAIASRLPRGRLKVIPNAGHMAPMEQAAVVNGILLEFVRTTIHSDG